MYRLALVPTELRALSLRMTHVKNVKVTQKTTEQSGDRHTRRQFKFEKAAEVKPLTKLLYHNYIYI